MNKKLTNLLQPGMRLYYIILALFTAATFIYGPEGRTLAYIELAVLIALLIYTRLSAKKRSEQLLSYIESVSSDVDAAAATSLANFPLPIVIFNPGTNSMIWSNDKFVEITHDRPHTFEVSLGDILPDFPTKWLLDGRTECPDLITLGDSKYRVYGSLGRADKADGGHEYLATTYWVDMTEYTDVYDEYINSRPITSILMIDNYDEFFKNLSEKDKSQFLSMIDDKISAWAGSCGGHLCKYDRDRYLFMFEDRYLLGFVNEKFSILDGVREVVNSAGLHATLSIGIGKDGASLAENFQFAQLGIEMALSRGGDQAIVRNKFNFEFYGGHSSEVEKRTKVKSRVMANAFGELVNNASMLLVMGHKQADLDTVGAAVGVCCIAHSCGKKAYIVIDESNNFSQALIDRIRELPEYADVFISAQDAILTADSKSLLVVVDTNRPDQVESETLLESCNHVVVIDHHRRAADYIQNTDINFHEPYASSAAELVTEMIQYLVEQTSVLRAEAEALLAGMVLDTKSFSIRTGSRTFDAAAYLRRAGADTSEVKKLLQSDFQTAQARYAIITGASIYRGGVAIASSNIESGRIVAAQAADELLNISGVDASFVLTREGDSIGVSGRSIGSCNVQLILEKLGGGGNKSTAGAQLRGVSLEEATARLKMAIDNYMDDESSTDS